MRGRREPRDREPPAVPLPPLADLHRHLDGAVRRTTLEELARARGRSLRQDLWLRPGLGLERVLSRLRLVLEHLQEPATVRRVAAEACEDAAAEGVTTLELRLAPQLHRGGPPEEVVDAALDGVAGRAGLVLCGLHGEPPAVLEGLVELAAGRPGVVGIDLAGAPSPEHRWILESYARAFRRARDLGLGRTVHAGEGRTAEEVEWAVEALGATRVGQATTLADDPDVLALVVARGVVVEVCPTSNLHAECVASFDEHPLGRLLDAGVRVTIGTDHPTLAGTDAPAEYRRALALPGVGPTRLAALVATGHEAAFRRGG